MGTQFLCIYGTDHLYLYYTYGSFIFFKDFDVDFVRLKSVVEFVTIQQGNGTNKWPLIFKDQF